MITETHGDEALTDHHRGPKNSLTRLLDLTVGWAQYVEETESEFGDAVSSTELYDLYQDAAQLSDSSASMTDTEVKEFILARIVPLVCGSNSA